MIDSFDDSDSHEEEEKEGSHKNLKKHQTMNLPQEINASNDYNDSNEEDCWKYHQPMNLPKEINASNDYSDSNEEDCWKYLPMNLPKEMNSHDSTRREEEYSQKVIKILRKREVSVSVIILVSFLLCRCVFRETAPSPCRFNVITLSEEFTHQHSDLWAVTRAILKSDPKSVKSLVLLHSPDAQRTATCLADRLARAFSCNKTESKPPTKIYPEDLTGTEDYGEIIEKYRNNMNGAVVVHDLSDIDKNAALAFHTLCDDITPGSPPTLVIFTIPKGESMNDRPSKMARKILKSAWGGLSFNLLDPLLSRILGYVIEVRQEDEVPCI